MTLLRITSAIAVVVAASVMGLVGVVLGTVALFLVYGLVVTPSDVGMLNASLVVVSAVLLGIGAARCIQYAVDRAVPRLD